MSPCGPHVDGAVGAGLDLPGKGRVSSFCERSSVQTPSGMAHMQGWLTHKHDSRMTQGWPNAREPSINAHEVRLEGSSQAQSKGQSLSLLGCHTVQKRPSPWRWCERARSLRHELGQSALIPWSG
ncbi:hypothetical protein HaLaN_30335 [Haematococcus lacustris]|uniref:Uncharacterized protein n=1 Tax=Haematococcus lacustris TaxID=44745 RepID=A0A6A0AF97_HAELA|nr:hypothetical protein HaLaN_30335 [Haematococcus lacustris]